MIIFNEYKFAQEMLRKGFSRLMSTQELIILARYLRYIGKNEDQIISDIFDFCAKHFDGFNPINNLSKIKRAIQTSNKYPLVIANPIPITQKEIDTIKNLKDYKSEKVLFLLLVSAKHQKLNVGSKNYCAYIKRTEMFTLAKVHTTKDEKNNIINNLDQQTGLIDTQLFGKGVKASFLVTFIDEDGEALFYVDDFDNIIGFYPIYCEVCGIEIEKTGRNHKMCKKCWKEKYKQINKERMRKTRNEQE